MLYWLIAIFHSVVMPIAALHVLVSKRDHRAALGWIGVVVLFPVAGPLIYFLFGINRVQVKARLFAGHHLPVMYLGYERTTRISGYDQDPVAEQSPYAYLATIGGRATRRPLALGNRVQALINGEQFFPHLLRAVESAEQCVVLSSYLFSAHGVAGDLIDALGRAASRGVSVHVLIDGVGTLYSLRSAVQPLRACGVQVELFRPPGLVPPTLDINLRNHRKIVVVDNRLGFFGGINIDQRHMVEDPDNPNKTEDLHFQVEGPAAASLREIFARDWAMVTTTPLPPPSEPPPVAGEAACRVIDDGPNDNLNHLSMTLITLFTAARRDITIVMPYFLPSHEMIAALQAAQLRGTRVRILLPEQSNLRYVDWATRNMLWELLLWDIEIYYKPAPFNHTKLILVDHHYVLGGSANLDARSLRLNYELGVEMFDSGLAEALQTHVDAAIGVSRAVSLEEMDRRPFWQRVRDAFFWLFSSYL